MVHVYGTSGAEKNLLRECSPKIHSIQDIKPSLKKQQSILEQRKNKFFEDLPSIIEAKKNNYAKLIENRDEMEIFWDNKIFEKRNEFNENKLRFWKYIELLLLERSKKPNAIKKVNHEIKNQSDEINLLENNPDDYFNREQNDIILEIKQLQRVLDLPDYPGAIGEISVLNHLKNLGDTYHVFCDLNIKLKDYVRYKGTRNLRSAQMDFVVVGQTGIFLIEVKNWSENFQMHHQGLSPHEQADRAGLVLWIYLKKQFFIYTPRVQNLLVSLQGNFNYNKSYKCVFCMKPYNLCNFISNHNMILKQNKIDKIVKVLR